MPIRSFASLVPRIQPSAPGCPQATIVQYIRDAAIRTCERTLYWRHQTSLFDLVPNIYEYDFDKPDGTDVHVIFETIVDGQPLRRVTMEDAVKLYPQWSNQNGTPRIVTQLNSDKFIVLPSPDTSRIYKCYMFVALKPKYNADGMEEAIFNELEEVIMHGALQHLLVLPNQKWSDRELASYHAKQYVYQVAERRARINLGNYRGMMRVQMQSFGV